MSDKTQLEIDLEKREHVKKPSGRFIFIVFSFISLVALGIYTMTLKQELAVKEQKIMLTKFNCDNEKTELLNKIKGLVEKEHRELKSGLESVTDTSNTVVQKGIKKKQ